MSAILAIDAGTTAFKAVLFSREMKILGSSTREFEILHPTPQQSELDVDAYWESCASAVRESLVQSGLPPDEVCAIAVTSHTDTLFALDASGHPLARAILWTDPRAQKNADAIQQRVGAERIFRNTGQTGASAVHFGARLAWFIENHPELARGARYYLQTQDFLIYRLCRQAALDQTIACCSLMGYLERNEYWPDMLDFIGVEAEKLSRIVCAGDIVGTLTDEVSGELGLPQGVPVVAGAMDATAAQVALGNVRPGTVTEITGAALVIGAVSDTPRFDDNMRVPCFAHAVPGKYLLLPWCETAGAALKWYRDQFFSPWAASDSSLYDTITAEAAEVSPGSDGVLFLPYFAGSGSPDFDPSAKVAIWGLTVAHERKHISRALLEGVAFMLKRNLDLLSGMGVCVDSLISSGGGSRSALWCQIKADVTGLPIVVTDLREATATGAALLAGKALNWWTLESITVDPVRLESGSANPVRGVGLVPEGEAVGTTPTPLTGLTGPGPTHLTGSTGDAVKPSPAVVQKYKEAYRRFVELDEAMKRFTGKAGC